MIESEFGDYTSLSPVALTQILLSFSLATEELMADKGDHSFSLQLEEVGRHITFSIRKVNVGSTGGTSEVTLVSWTNLPFTADFCESCT